MRVLLNLHEMLPPLLPPHVAGGFGATRWLFPRLNGKKYPPAGPDSREAKRRRRQVDRIAARRAGA